MAGRSVMLRLVDIIGAIEVVRPEMVGVTLRAFEPDIRKRWVVERGCAREAMARQYGEMLGRFIR